MTTTRFEIWTRSDEQALPRVLEHFAMRTLVPDRIVAECEGGLLHVTIVQEGLDEGISAIIAEKLRASVLVERVALSVERTCMKEVMQ